MVGTYLYHHLENVLVYDRWVVSTAFTTYVGPRPSQPTYSSAHVIIGGDEPHIVSYEYNISSLSSIICKIAAFSLLL